MSGWRQSGSRHARGYDHRWVKARDAVMIRDGYLCQPCKREGTMTTATEVDHIIPKFKGGTNDPSNLEATCQPHHAEKTRQETAEAQGRTARQRPRYDDDGWPV